jgi:tRNA 2-thiocytidine biosynthesis protein TtcA
MPARLRSDDGRNVVIRPLVYASEVELAELAQLKQFPIIPCDLCGSQDNLKRKQVKQLLTTLNDANPTVRANVFAALGNVRPSHLFDVELQRLLGAAEAQEDSAAGGVASNVIPLTALRR